MLDLETARDFTKHGVAVKVQNLLLPNSGYHRANLDRYGSNGP
jgi:hypothetical protein